MRTVLLVLIYFLAIRMWRQIKVAAEKLEELEGEFIYTSLNNFLRKETYFSLNEIRAVTFSKVYTDGKKFKGIMLRIFLKDGYAIMLRKKENCILFLKSCKENNEELYRKIVGGFSIGMIDISGIVENEIENYDEMQK